MLVTAGKVLNRILLEGMKEALDSKIWEVQAGNRDLVMTLRITGEQLINNNNSRQ